MANTETGESNTEKSCEEETDSREVGNTVIVIEDTETAPHEQNNEFPEPCNDNQGQQHGPIDWQ